MKFMSFSLQKLKRQCTRYMVSFFLVNSLKSITFYFGGA